MSHSALLSRHLVSLGLRLAVGTILSSFSAVWSTFNNAKFPLIEARSSTDTETAMLLFAALRGRAGGPPAAVAAGGGGGVAGARAGGAAALARALAAARRAVRTLTDTGDIMFYTFEAGVFGLTVLYV